MNTQEREKIITNAVAEFDAGLRSKAEQFEATHAERKLTISVSNSFTFSSLAQYRHGSASKITLQDREKPRSGFSPCGF
jgi:hypothetical protein